MAVEFVRRSKKGVFGIKNQSPSPRVEVFVEGNPQSPDLTYEGNAKDDIQSKLLGYTFSESTDDLGGSFSITVENEKIVINGKAKTVFDAIKIRSVVKIYEADPKKPSFVGIVKKRRIKSTITGQGPKRTIVFSGKSIISAVSEYTVTTDFRTLSTDPEIESKKFSEELSQSGLSIKSFMEKAWDKFTNVGEQTGVSSTVIKKIIADFIGTFDNFVSNDNDNTMHYNVTGAFFSEGNNTIDQLWRNVLPEPVYEIYAYCDRETGKPMIKAREVPFGFPDTNNQDWNDLDIYEIDPLDLTDYDLTESDDEVYTVFMSYLIGSAMSSDFYLGTKSKQNTILAKDDDKLSIYGYRPLQISFRGYDRQKTEKDGLDENFKELNKKAQYWYGRMDEMFGGPITLITDFTLDEKKRDRNPRIGCRARFLGGEFYINRADHVWNYGGTPTITLTVSRGIKYDNQGYQIKGEEGVLSDIGKKFKELE